MGPVWFVTAVNEMSENSDLRQENEALKLGKTEASVMVPDTQAQLAQAPQCHHDAAFPFFLGLAAGVALAALGMAVIMFVTDAWEEK